MAGRYAALRAAAEGHDRFDVEVVVTDQLLTAVAELAQLLADWPAHPLTTTPLDHDVAAFRRFLGEESARQRAGEAPRPCPLPT